MKPQNRSPGLAAARPRSERATAWATAIAYRVGPVGSGLPEGVNVGALMMIRTGFRGVPVYNYSIVYIPPGPILIFKVPIKRVLRRLSCKLHEGFNGRRALLGLVTASLVGMLRK